MIWQIELRIGNPSEVTQSMFTTKQTIRSSDSMVVAKILSCDPNFFEAMECVKNRKKNGEFLSFIESRFLWSGEEISQAKSFVLSPYRRYYNEVIPDNTLSECVQELDKGYKRIQKTPLILPSINKNTGSEIKYLSNGCLVIGSSFKKRLDEAGQVDLEFLPILAKQESSVDLDILDMCILNKDHHISEETAWYQVVSRNSVRLDNADFDPFDIYKYSEDIEPCLHVARDRYVPLTGRFNDMDGGYSAIGFGAREMGAWRFYRPLIISKELFPVFKSAKQNSIIFDPFLESLNVGKQVKL